MRTLTDEDVDAIASRVAQLLSDNPGVIKHAMQENESVLYIEDMQARLKRGRTFVTGLIAAREIPAFQLGGSPAITHKAWHAFLTRLQKSAKGGKL